MLAKQIKSTREEEEKMANACGVLQKDGRKKKRREEGEFVQVGVGRL